MNKKQVVALNTIVLYVKLLVTTVIALFTTRIMLLALGVEDFGLYNIIAGVITLLTFLNGAMMTSTQRYLSVSLGRNCITELKQIFSASIVMHIAIAIVLCLLLLAIQPLLFNGMVLDIPVGKVDVAKSCYHIMIVTTMVTVMAVPFNATINSHEDMWFFAIVETVVSVSKLVCAYLLYHVDSDRLVLYCLFLLLINAGGALIKCVWSLLRYEEVSIRLKSNFEAMWVRRMGSFVAWNSIGAFSQVCRSQGVAVVLNSFFGVVVNAAYGITNQVNTLLAYFSQILTSSMAPQIMKSKGENNNVRMRAISIFASKVAFTLSCIMSIFILLDLPLILSIWLKNVPELSAEFCGYTVWVFLVMQLYPGLVRMIQADGNIRNYQLFTSAVLLLSIPGGILLFKLGYSPVSIFALMLILQILTLAITVYFAHRLCGLDARAYLADFVIRAFALFIAVYLSAKWIYGLLEPNVISLAAVALTADVVLVITFYLCVFNKSEISMIYKLIKVKG